MNSTVFNMSKNSNYVVKMLGFRGESYVLSNKKIAKTQKLIKNNVKRKRNKIFNINKYIRIIDEYSSIFDGKIKKINHFYKKVGVMFNIFQREVKAKLGFYQIEKIINKSKKIICQNSI